jgi:hypothetical protein
MDSHPCLVYLVSQICDLTLTVVEILVLFIINDSSSKLCVWLPITYRILGLVTCIKLHQFGHALRLSLRILFVLDVILDLKLLLPGHEITLMCILSLYSPRHILLPSIVANVGCPRKLIGQPLFTHVLLHAVNDLNNVVNVLFKLLSLLQTIHWNHLCFLICNGIKVSLIWLSWCTGVAVNIYSFGDGNFH